MSQSYPQVGGRQQAPFDSGPEGRRTAITLALRELELLKRLRDSSLGARRRSWHPAKEGS